MPYTFDKDYQEPLTDGSGRYRKLFSAGQSIPWETAKELGLVTGREPKTEDKKAQREETQR